MITKDKAKKLLEAAEKAMANSHSPYSGFRVGAALLLKNQKIYTGCNIENSAFSPSCCAERVAFFKAVSEGEKDFCAIAVTGGADGEQKTHCYPCGVCRQVMAEFCGGDFEIVTGKGEDIKITKLSDLLPLAFSLKKEN